MNNFIVLTGKQKRNVVYVNIDAITSIEDGDEYNGTKVYMSDGCGDPYIVMESAYTVMKLIENCEKRRKETEGETT